MKQLLASQKMAKKLAVSSDYAFVALMAKFLKLKKPQSPFAYDN